MAFLNNKCAFHLLLNCLYCLVSAKESIDIDSGSGDADIFSLPRFHDASREVSPIPECYYWLKSNCYVIGPAKMRQREAHSFCRRNGGFLPDDAVLRDFRETLPVLSSQEITWSALIFKSGHYQWLTEIPHSGVLTEWDVGYIPSPWEEGCFEYRVKTGEYYFNNCSNLHNFVCIISEENRHPDGVTLKLSANVKNENGWIEIEDEDSFRKIILTCSPRIKDSKGRAENDLKALQIHWNKDGIMLGRNSSSLHPASLITNMLGTDNPPWSMLPEVFPTLREGNMSAEEDLMSLKQGTYCCQSWIPFSDDSLQSNCILITVRQFPLLVINLKLRGDENNPFIVLNKYFPKNGIIFQYLSIDSILEYSEFSTYLLITSKRYQNISASGTSEYTYEFIYYMFSRAVDINQTLSDINYEIQTNNPVTVLRESYVKAVTYCGSFINLLDYGNEVLYPFARAGDHYTSLKFKCEIYNPKLNYPYCQWNNTHGAQIVFPNCTRYEICPRGFKTIKNQFCVKIQRNTSWEESHKSFHSLGIEKSLLEEDSFFMGGNSSLYSYITDYLIDSNVSEIWLMCKRLYELTPIINFNQQTEQQLMVFRYSGGIYNFSWEENHPLASKMCVKLNLLERKYYSSDCKVRGNFVSIVELDELLTLHSSNILDDNGKCKANYKTFSTTKGLNICVRYFDELVNASWKQADKFCQSHNAHLPSPYQGFKNWYYQNKSWKIESKVWMNFSNKKKFLNNETVSYVNWSPETNYSKIYGAFDNESWYLEDEFLETEGVFCEYEIPFYLQGTIEIQRQSSETELCVKVPAHYEETPLSMSCFANGNVIPVFYTENPYCPVKIGITGQGIYECLVWSLKKKRLIESNPFLFVNESLKSFVVLGYDVGRNYISMDHDSTFISLESRSRFDNRCMYLAMTTIAERDEWINIPEVLFHSGNNNSFSFIFRIDCLQDSTICSSIQNLKEYLSTLFPFSSYSKTISKANNSCYIDEIRSTKGCMADTTKDTFKNRNITWSYTEGGENAVAEELCIKLDGDLVTRQCAGNFIVGFYWKEIPPGCPGNPSPRTKSLYKIFKDPDGFIKGEYGTLSSLTSDMESLLPSDFYFASSTLRKLSENSSYSKNVSFNEVVLTMNNLLGVSKDTFDSVYNKFNSSAELIYSFETLAFETRGDFQSLENGRKVSSQGNIIAECIDIAANPSVIGFRSNASTGSLLTEKIIEMNDTKVAIILPKSIKEYLFKGNKSINPTNAQILFATYKISTIFHDPHAKSYSYEVNSEIIHVTVENHIHDLDENVMIYYRPERNEGDMKCVYWDINQNGRKGGWSEEGCNLVNVTNNFVTCECNHLSIFSLLIKYNSNALPTIHKEVLTIISIIGCSLSILSLSLVILTFVVFKKFRNSQTNKIILNLSISLLISLVIFLSGSTQIEYDKLCKAIGIMLHYFILASFGWMIVVGLQMYLKFVKVIGTYIPKFMLKASIFAWTIPVIPILITACINIDLYGSQSDDEICWMSETAFLYSFLPSISIFLIINFAIYLKIIDNVIIRRKTIQSTLKQRDLVISQVTMAVSISFSLGFTWFFGLLIMTGAQTIFSYLFCLFQTLQGFFIFLFHVCGDRSAKRMWRDILQNMSGFSSGKTSDQQTNTRSKELQNEDIILKFPQNKPHKKKINLRSFKNIHSSDSYL